MRRLRLTAVLLGATVVGAVPSVASQTPRQEPAPLLDLYAAGRFEEALARFRALPDKEARDLRLRWVDAGRRWIDVSPEGHRRRLLTAAALALDLEGVLAERGEWSNSAREKVNDKDILCAAPCVLEWASLLLVERGAPDAPERAWRLAATTLAEGVRDWRALHAPVLAREPFGEAGGLLATAIARFPDDARFRFHRALAVASRFNVTTDGGLRSVTPMLLVRPQEGARGLVAAELSALRTDPSVGAEARLRLGFLHWTGGNEKAADHEFAAAAAQTSDRDVRYLARFLAGWTAQQRGDVARAVAAYASALDARPYSQSASLALAALELQQGNASKADELTAASLTERPADADPWRLFLYGHHHQWPALMAAVRESLQ